MDDLLADFVAETREMLEASQGEIIAWEADPSDRSRLDAIFRFVHTVKGNCGFFDFPRLERLSHAAEDALSDVRAGRRHSDAELVTAILAIIDRISEMADAIEAGEEFPEGGDDVLIAALQNDHLDTGLAQEAESEETSPDSDEPIVEKKVRTNQGSGSSGTSRTIRLPTELLDRVMSGVSDMVLARNDLAHRLRMTGNQPTIDGPFERLTAILTDVRDAITRMRMQRIEHLFSLLPRLVRDLSNELGKQVLIDLEGGNVELDREMVEMIRDPLTHIIRNALDHGIEPPSERLKSGKRETGLLSIAARQSGNKISIVISDDGRGLNLDRVCEKALENGLVTKQALGGMTREEKLDLVFEPGLSTAEKVSSVSGRGVGLDVVRDNLERVGGTIKVSSTPGSGTLFYLTIPLTLSIIAGITIEQGNECFAIPQSYVEEIVQLDSESLDFTTVGERGLVTFRGQRVPCLSLQDVLGIEHALEMGDRAAVMVRLASGDLIALLADKVQNISDLVVKPLPPAIMQSDLYGGSTQLDDGTPILVLDIPQIAYNTGLISDTRLNNIGERIEKEAEEATGIRAMIFTGFDGRRRAMRMDLIQRIETIPVSAVDQTGSQPRVVIDGQLLSLIGLESGQLPEEKLRFLRLSDGHSDIAYAIANVEDAALLDEELTSAKGEEFVEGIAIVDGEPIALLDGFAIFAKYGTSKRRKSSLTCSLPETDWAKSILGPLVAKCGYDIIPSSSKNSPDVQIVMGNNPAATDKSAGKVIVINEMEEDDAEAGDSIYRYDEGKLIKALKRARTQALKNRPTAQDEEAA